MRKTVVTGATGFIAVHLINMLIDNGDFVYAVVKPQSANLSRLNQNDNLKIIELDINEIDTLPNIIGEDVDVFYHLAWQGTRGVARNDKEVQAKNYFGAINAIVAAHKMNSKVFIGTGSQAEYGAAEGKIDETYIENPETEYGKAKLKAKRDCEKFAEKNNIKFIWARFFSVYGEYDYENTLIMSCINKMSKNEDIELSDCEQKWDYLYVKDAASALMMFGLQGCSCGEYNVANGNAEILKNYVIKIKEIMKSESNLKFGAICNYARNKAFMEPSIKKIMREISWKPETSFEDGINNILYARERGGGNK